MCLLLEFFDFALLGIWICCLRLFDVFAFACGLMTWLIGVVG